jgi:hypothetical protein
MHVDGAYTVFRGLRPQLASFAAFPALGRQRSSLSDITPTNMFLDQWAATRGLAKIMRRARNWLARR